MDSCVLCGEYIPEGRQVCPTCELTKPKELVMVLKKEREREREREYNHYLSQVGKLLGPEEYEERLNRLREEALNQMKQEFFLMEFNGIKRAVKYFKIIRKKHIGGTSDFYNLAINALERQIPQKPREYYHWGDFTKEEKLENNQWFCGKCGWQIGEEDNYCNECGQRVDWS